VQGGVENARKNRKNWDKLVAGELEDKEDSSDPVSSKRPEYQSLQVQS
jgi:hypothetical protein